MSGLLEEQKQASQTARRPGEGRRVSIVGAPCGFGASIAGVDLGPAAMRVAGLRRRIESLGYAVRDLGDLHFDCPNVPPAPGERLRFLPEITAACEHLARDVKKILEGGELPVVLGGDHSVAIGSVAGVTSFYRGRGRSVGLIWFDAHADMNTPETTPSGNIHGMPLAVLLGYGAPSLTGIEGFSPKLDPRLCAHIGARDVDPGERELIKRLGIRFFTMREIDERGMTLTRSTPATRPAPARSSAAASRTARRISRWKRSPKPAARSRSKSSRSTPPSTSTTGRRNSASN